MPDGVTPGELDRRLQAHEQRTDRIHGELDNRITDLASKTVPWTTYQAGERSRDEAVARLEREHDQDMAKFREDVVRPVERRLEALEQRPALTIGRAVAVLTALVALAALVIQAYGTLKGAR